MSTPPEVLNPLSELFAVSTRGIYRNVIALACECHGRLDLEALRSAVHETVDRFPRLMSGIKQIWRRGRFVLEWEVRPHLRKDLAVHDLPSAASIENPFAAIYDMLLPAMKRGLDPFKEVAGEFHLVRLSEGRHVIVLMVHHCAADAVELVKIPLTLLANYHKTLAGEVPRWTSELRIFTHQRDRRKEPEVRIPKGLSLRTKWFPWPRRREFGRIGGTGHPNDTGYSSRRWIFSRDQTQRIQQFADAQPVNLVDYANACVHLAVGEWNRGTNQRTETLSTALTIDLAGRLKNCHGPNCLGQIFLQSNASQRAEPSSLPKVLEAGRIKQNDQRIAVLGHRTIERGQKIVGPFPLSVKRAAGYFLLHTLKWGVADIQINFFGTLMPKRVDGRPSRESVVPHGADLELADVWPMVYKTFPRVPLHIWLYVYRERLSMVLASRASQFSVQEEEAFGNLLADMLLNYPSDAGSR